MGVGMVRTRTRSTAVDGYAIIKKQLCSVKFQKELVAGESDRGGVLMGLGLVCGEWCVCVCVCVCVQLMNVRLGYSVRRFDFEVCTHTHTHT